MEVHHKMNVSLTSSPFFIIVFGLILVICPVDEFSTLAENIFTHLQNYDYDDARAEAQKLINLADQVEDEKIKEDNKELRMYQ